MVHYYAEVAYRGGRGGGEVMAVDEEVKFFTEGRRDLGPKMRSSVLLLLGFRRLLSIQVWCVIPYQVLLGKAGGAELRQFDSGQSVAVIKDMTGGMGSLPRTLVKMLMAAEHAICFQWLYVCDTKEAVCKIIRFVCCLLPKSFYLTATAVLCREVAHFLFSFFLIGVMSFCRFFCPIAPIGESIEARHLSEQETSD